MTDLNLRHMVQKALLASESVEYADIAAQVLAALPKRRHAAALTEALPAFVRAVAITQRGTATAQPDPPDIQTSQPESWKVKGYRAWAHRLTDTYTGAHGRKRLGDFTFDDLQFLADKCRDLAEKNAASAAQWDRLAEAVKDAGVEHVRDLPPEDLSELLGAVA